LETVCATPSIHGRLSDQPVGSVWREPAAAGSIRANGGRLVSEAPVEQLGTISSVGPGRPAFIWQDFSRFVEVSPVRTGWLVVWGRYDSRGHRRVLRGNRVYRDLAGVRRRLADAVLELTGNSALVEEALGLLDRHAIPAHPSALPPEPL
jgi:hypothetical protein